MLENNIRQPNGDLRWKKIKKDFIDKKLPTNEESSVSVDSDDAPLHFTLSDPDQIRQYCKLKS